MAKRRQFTAARRRKIAERFEYCCAYCRVLIGSVVTRNGKLELLKGEIDHFVPVTHFSDNSDDNIVLACNVCNTLKSNDHYATAAAVTLGIADRRLEWQLVWSPPVSDLENPDRWAVAYASFLSGAR